MALAPVAIELFSYPKSEIIRYLLTVTASSIERCLSLHKTTIFNFM